MSAPTRQPDARGGVTSPAGIGSAFLGRVPPHSEEAEVAVLGGILLNNSAMDQVADIVVPGDFYADAHGIIFQAFQDLHLANRPLDLITLSELLKDRGELESAGDRVYLNSLLDSVPTAANIESYATVVAEKAMVRRCIAAALDILQQGYGEYGDAGTFLDVAEQSVFKATEKRGQSKVVKVESAIKKAVSEIDRLSKLKSDITGVPTGYTQLDRMTTGLQAGDLVIVAGRPSMGKTAFALNIATNAVRLAGTGVLVFSLEMSSDQLVRRLLAAEASIPSNRIRLPHKMHENDFAALIEAADRFYRSPMYLDDSAEINVLEIRSRARRLKSRTDIGLIIVDYLQIMQAVRSHKGETNREREIAEITRSLKALAKELSVPVIVLSQLNRGPEARQDKRPMMQDLRESGAIEQDADLIMFLYRDAAYNRDSTDSTAEIIIGKNRNGPVGTVNLSFQKEFTRFDNIEEDSIYDTMPGTETSFDPGEPPPGDGAPFPLGEDEPDDDSGMPF